MKIEVLQTFATSTLASSALLFLTENQTVVGIRSIEIMNWLGIPEKLLVGKC